MKNEIYHLRNDMDRALHLSIKNRVAAFGNIGSVERTKKIKEKEMAKLSN